MTDERGPEQATSEFKTHVATCIKTWREKMKPTFSREELAARMLRSMATVQRWERDGDPRLSEVNQMEGIKPGLLASIFPLGDRRRRRPRRSPVTSGTERRGDE
jgi:hypothetical protein